VPFSSPQLGSEKGSGLNACRLNSAAVLWGQSDREQPSLSSVGRCDGGALFFFCFIISAFDHGNYGALFFIFFRLIILAFSFFNFIILYSAVLGHDPLS